MTHKRRHVPAAVALAGAFLLAGCVSNFEFELPEHHPAQPDSPASGPLGAPSPFDVAPPGASEGEMQGMHQGHDGAETQPEQGSRGHEMKGGKH